MQSPQSATTPWILTFQKGTEKTSARTRNRNKKWQTICRLKFSRKTEKGKKKDRKILYHEMNHSTFPDSNNIQTWLWYYQYYIQKLYTYLKYKSIIQLSCVRSNKG